MSSEIQQSMAGLGLTVITTLAGWLWAKVRGQKRRDLTELLDETITEEVEDALDDNMTAAEIEGRLEEAARRLAKRLGVTLPRPMANIAIAYGMTEFKKKVRARRANQGAVQTIPGQLAEVSSLADAVTEVFTAKSVIPKLEMEVEVVK